MASEMESTPELLARLEQVWPSFWEDTAQAAADMRRERALSQCSAESFDDHDR